MLIYKVMYNNMQRETVRETVLFYYYLSSSRQREAHSTRVGSLSPLRRDTTAVAHSTVTHSSNLEDLGSVAYVDCSKRPKIGWIDKISTYARYEYLRDRGESSGTSKAPLGPSDEDVFLKESSGLLKDLIATFHSRIG